VGRDGGERVVEEKVERFHHFPIGKSTKSLRICSFFECGDALLSKQHDVNRMSHCSAFYI
jgi:hypothetical protein